MGRKLSHAKRKHRLARRQRIEHRKTMAALRCNKAREHCRKEFEMMARQSPIVYAAVLSLRQGEELEGVFYKTTVALAKCGDHLQGELLSLHQQGGVVVHLNAEDTVKYRQYIGERQNSCTEAIETRRLI